MREGTVVTHLTADGRILFAARIVRMFGYGFLAVVLALYLAALGLDEWRIGLLLTLTLVGDTAVSLWMSTHADRYGRRTMLAVGSLLLLGAGLVFIGTDRFVVLLAAATIGVISPSGYEVGPFLAIEQAALSQAVPGERRTHVFAWYNLAGSVATAVGSLAGGGIARLGQAGGLTPLASYRVVLAGYAALGGVLAWLFWRLSPSVEVAPIPRPSPTSPRFRFGLHHSGGVVLRLSGLFALDAFGGGFVIQSMLAYWFYLRFGTDEATLGAIFFGANLLAGVSALMASRIAARFGLVNTMVFTHLPSNVLLDARAAHADAAPGDPGPAPPVQHLPDGRAHAPVVHHGHRPPRGALGRRGHHRHRPHRRRGAAPRSVPACCSAHPPLMSGLFFVAGGLKILYDLLLLRSFRRVKPPEESTTG